MSSTIKEAIQALKGRVADAYTAISNKGGTLPATQDSANLPSAIASIPSGGGSAGMYDYLKQIGASDADVLVPNQIGQVTIDESNNTTGVNKPLVRIANIDHTTFTYNSGTDRSLEVIVADTMTGNLYQPFFRRAALHTIIVGGGEYIKAVPTNAFYTFHDCTSLRNVLFILDCVNSVSVITNANSAPNIREIRLKNVGVSVSVSKWAGLSYTSLLYLVTNLQNVSGETLTLGSGNIAKINATAEGQAAIATAQAMGWTIA